MKRHNSRNSSSSICLSVCHCVTARNDKMYFGKGTKLTVETGRSTFAFFSVCASTEFMCVLHLCIYRTGQIWIDRNNQAVSNTDTHANKIRV